MMCFLIDDAQSMQNELSMGTVTHVANLWKQLCQPGAKTGLTFKILMSSFCSYLELRCVPLIDDTQNMQYELIYHFLQLIKIKKINFILLKYLPRLLFLCPSFQSAPVSFIILYWLRSQIADMYSFVTFSISCHYCVSRSYCIILFIVLHWLQSEIADMYSFVTFFISYSLLCLHFILAFIRDFQADAWDPDEEEEETQPLVGKTDMKGKPGNQEDDEQEDHKVIHFDHYYQNIKAWTQWRVFCKRSNAFSW